MPIENSPSGKHQGKVKWFNSEKGYGFIQPDDETDDIFVHFSGIEGSGYRELQPDQKVEYKKEQGKKGWQAVEVRALSAGQPSESRAGAPGGGSGVGADRRNGGSEEGSHGHRSYGGGRNPDSD